MPNISLFYTEAVERGNSSKNVDHSTVADRHENERSKVLNNEDNYINGSLRDIRQPDRDHQ